MEKVVIIGGGIAGRFASRILMEKGYQITIIDDRRGETWYFSGVVNVGFIPNRGLEGQIDINAEEIVTKIQNFFPYHIYSEDTPDGVVDYVRNVFTSVRSFNAYHSLSGKTIPFLTTEGTIHTGISAFRTILSFPDSGNVVVLIPDCLKDISIEGIKLNLYEVISAMGWSVNLKIEPVEFFCKIGNFSLLEANRLFDDHPEYLEKIISLTKTYTGANIFIPPILGVKKWKENYEVLTQEVDANISEMAAVRESPFGLRWEMECADTLEPVVKIKGRIKDAKIGDEGVLGVYTEGGTFIEGDKFVLATGKFLAGGLYRNLRRAEETLFHFPIFIGEKVVVPEEDIQTYLGKSFFDYHPLWFAGVKRDEEGRPVNRWGEVVLPNLFAVGSVVSGVDHLNSGAGFSATIYSIKKVGFLNE